MATKNEIIDQMITAMAAQVKPKLDNQAKIDTDFASDYNNRKDKSVEDFCKVLYNSYLKSASSTTSAVFGSDEVLVGWAIHYWHEDNVTEIDVSACPLCKKPKAAAKPKATAAKEDKPTPKPKAKAKAAVVEDTPAPKATMPIKPAAPTAPAAQVLDDDDDFDIF